MKRRLPPASARTPVPVRLTRYRPREWVTEREHMAWREGQLPTIDLYLLGRKRFLEAGERWRVENAYSYADFGNARYWERSK